MTDAVVWVGLDRGDADLAHLDHELLAVLEDLEAPLVCTHVVDGHHAASARVRLDGVLPAADRLAALARRFGGALVAVGAPGDPALELGDERFRAGARTAAAALRAGREGRAVRFPGQEALTGRLTVAEVPARSAIAELVAIGTVLEDDRVLDTRGYVRPLLSDGALRLTVVPAAAGTVIPHERPGRHDCGKDH